MKSRPNSNYILQVMRDGDMDDPWGTAMSMAFAVAECLTVIEQSVPEELGFQPSPFVRISTLEEFAEILSEESYDHTIVWDYLQGTDFSLGRIRDVQFAGRCLARYIDWCKAAGRDY